MISTELQKIVAEKNFAKGLKSKSKEKNR